MAYIFNAYTDKGGAGYQQEFETKEAAIEFARKEWDHLDPKDKANYKNDCAGAFEAIECGMVEIDGELVPDMSEYNVLWSALEG